MLKQWGSFLLDLLFPPRCPICRSGVNTHGAWCDICLSAAWAPRWLDLASHGLTALDDCYTLCNYTAGIQRLIRSMKFRRERRYGRHINWLLNQAQLDCLSSFAEVIPVPLSAERLAARGYNQTEVMFRPWAQDHSFIWHDALVRIKTTAPQWELTLGQRRSNIKGAFAVTRHTGLSGKHILLVDDIFTSGTTMEECSQVLKQAGSSRVTGLVIASGAK